MNHVKEFSYHIFSLIPPTDLQSLIEPIFLLYQTLTSPHHSVWSCAVETEKNTFEWNVDNQPAMGSIHCQIEPPSQCSFIIHCIVKYLLVIFWPSPLFCTPHNYMSPSCSLPDIPLWNLDLRFILLKKPLLNFLTDLVFSVLITSFCHISWRYCYKFPLFHCVKGYLPLFLGLAYMWCRWSQVTQWWTSLPIIYLCSVICMMCAFFFFSAIRESVWQKHYHIWWLEWILCCFPNEPSTVRNFTCLIKIEPHYFSICIMGNFVSCKNRLFLLLNWPKINVRYSSVSDFHQCLKIQYKWLIQWEFHIACLIHPTSASDVSKQL